MADTSRLTVAVTPFDTLSPDTPDYAANAVAWALGDRPGSIVGLRVAGATLPGSTLFDVLRNR